MSDKGTTPTFSVRYELPNEATESEKLGAIRAAIYALFQKELTALRELRQESSLDETENRVVDMNLDTADGILVGLSERIKRGLPENEISNTYKEVQYFFNRAKAHLDFDRQNAKKSGVGASKGGKAGAKTKQNNIADRNRRIRREAEQLYKEGLQEKAVVSILSQRFKRNDGTCRADDLLSIRQIRRILKPKE